MILKFNCKKTNIRTQEKAEINRYLKFDIHPGLFNYLDEWKFTRLNVKVSLCDLFNVFLFFLQNYLN